MDEAFNSYYCLVAGVAETERHVELSGAYEASFVINRAILRTERAIIGSAGQIVEQKQNTIWAIFERPETCLIAALDIQKRVADLPKLKGLPLQMRIGIHYGQLKMPVSTSDEILRVTQQLALEAGEGRILASKTALLVAPQPFFSAAKKVETALKDRDVFQILEPQTCAESVSAPEKKPVLRLKMGSHIAQVSAQQSIILLGRDLGNDIVLSNLQASRQHARIEYKNGLFFLIDKSLNGTYVSNDGSPEVFVKGDVYALPASGRLGCGFSPDPDNAHTISFTLT